ncbi:AAA family ATPase [Streptococcus catagoni]|uniref:AAA family ATPase n=1 Tax=Streptococcus catagoni TaxID=2654874 RepID=UPI0014091F16|nr:AAA family ATPase [Streptococcus catagoni]
MNLVIIGAQASGKMTIGQELEKLTDMTLFHNHESIDFVLKFMPWSADATELIQKIRFDFFESFAKTGQGMIFTVVIDFNSPDDVCLLEQVQAIFHRYGREICFVELETDLRERLRRNKTENRLKHKPLKRDLKWSEDDILKTMDFALFNPKEAPKKLKHYHKINNTHLSAKEIAEDIYQRLIEIEEHQ